MTGPRRGRCALLTVLLLVVIAGVAMATTADFRLSDGIFALGGQAWPLPHAGWTRALGYEGPKYVLAVFGLLLLVGLARPGLLHGLHLERREAVYLLACLIAVPVLIGAIKYSSGVACADELVRYGGELADHLGHFTLARLWAPDKMHGCWPSGHASGGFALLALGMLDRPPATRRALWLAALAFGSVMSVYQLLRGAHFVSHVLVTALIAQLVVCVLARWLLGPGRPAAATAAA